MKLPAKPEEDANIVRKLNTTISILRDDSGSSYVSVKNKLAPLNVEVSKLDNFDEFNLQRQGV